jgi:hypothetical protein
MFPIAFVFSLSPLGEGWGEGYLSGRLKALAILPRRYTKPAFERR